MGWVIDLGLLAAAGASAAFAGYSYVTTRSSTAAANRSADAAETSAFEAERAAKAAEASVDLARSERDRAVERTDVVFERSPKHEIGVYTYTNVGTASAHNVQVLVFINDEKVELEIDKVASGDHFLLDGSAQLTAAKIDRAARERSVSGSGVVFVGMTRFSVRGRVSWQSELGTPGVQALD